MGPMGTEYVAGLFHSGFSASRVARILGARGSLSSTPEARGLGFRV